MDKVLTHLTNDLHWPVDRIHLFGFAQGGTVAAEAALQHWKKQRSTDLSISTSLASIITISGPLLSYPTLTSPSPTPVLIAHRPPPSEEALPSDALKSFQKGFKTVTEAKLSASRGGMPASKEEWEPIMRFWSQHLSRRKMDGLYEVMSGMSG